MTLRLRLAFLFAAVLTILSGLFLVSAQGYLLRHLRAGQHSNLEAPAGLSDEQIQSLVRYLTGLWLVAGVPITGLSFLLGFLIASRSVHHLRQINEGLGALEPSDLARGIKVPDKDPELQNLVRNINDLLGRIGRSYGEISQFSSRVAHELRTPLTLLRLRIEENADKLPPDFSEDLQEEIRRLTRLVERSLVTARAEGGVLELENTRLAICEILEGVREDYSALAGVKNLALHWHCPRNLFVAGDKDAVLQILHNLLDNAMRYAKSEVALAAGTERGGSMIRVEITNDRREISASERGTGLGLRLTEALVKNMPGWDFKSSEEANLYRTVLTTPAA